MIQIYGICLGRIEDFDRCCPPEADPDHTPSQICLPPTLRYDAILYACAGEALQAKSHRPVLLPPATIRHTSLQLLCLRLSFVTVRLGLDFARNSCHNLGQHNLAAGQSPVHNIKCMRMDGLNRTAFRGLG